MNNSGNDSDIQVDAVESQPLPANRRVPTRIIVLGLIAVVFAVVIGTQVIGVLYAIFFPPAVPLPDQVDLVSHTSSDYGTDDWLYSSSKVSACDIAQYYAAKSVQCRIAPFSCIDGSSTTAAGANARNQNVARCTGTQTFSIFALRWQVNIATGSSDEQKAVFRLDREIFWTGAVPPSNPPSLNGGFPNYPTDIPPPTTAS